MKKTKEQFPLRFSDGAIYIDASHRRKILDKWVHLLYGTQQEMLLIYDYLITGDYSKIATFDFFRDYNLANDPDIIYWRNHIRKWKEIQSFFKNKNE